MVLAHCNLRPLGSSNSSTSASLVAEITDVHYHTLLAFVVLLEMGVRYVGQACLKPLTSSDLPTSASQSLGITSVSHHTQSILLFFKLGYLGFLFFAGKLFKFLMYPGY